MAQLTTPTDADVSGILVVTVAAGACRPGRSCRAGRSGDTGCVPLKLVLLERHHSPGGLSRQPEGGKRSPNGHWQLRGRPFRLLAMLEPVTADCLDEASS
jgi:hypothetical protein